ncbi:MAG: hypothetical protein CMK96_08645 [Pseudomonas sp.]|jgi:hypothetical protein|nr:hypothetical protein [Pseudomonadales bacterium]MAK86994.1 hypothetical protein [Pseudomonas sp.]|tara:strand:- start:591 stop:938 length:348 start_codon:yes stop_codon:yes gene_type:complete
MKFEHTNERLHITLDAVNNIDSYDRFNNLNSTGTAGLVELQAGKHKTIGFFYLERGSSGYQLTSSLPIKISKNNKIMLAREFFGLTGMNKAQYKAHIKVFNDGLTAVFNKLIDTI